jgi:hypothetical protein
MNNPIKLTDEEKLRRILQSFSLDELLNIVRATEWLKMVSNFGYVYIRIRKGRPHVVRPIWEEDIDSTNGQLPVPMLYDDEGRC